MSVANRSSYRIEVVDPVAFVEPASLILQEAFQPPCLDYGPDYLCWLFSFPNGMESIGVAALDGDEPIAFFGLMPRWMRLGDRRIAVRVLSSVAVRPAWRGLPTPVMYEKLIEVIQEVGGPVVMYVRPGSAAERKLLWCFEKAGFRASSLGSYRTYGSATDPGFSSHGVWVEEGDEEAFLEVARSCDDERVLWRYMGREPLRHYRADPRGCALAVVRQAEGRPTGAALVVLSRVVVPKGIELVPMIDSIFLPRPSAEALIALIRFSRGHWNGRATSPVVTAPNLNGIDAAVLRAAGLRATPSVFQGYFCAPMAATLPEAITRTNMEII